MKLRSRPLPALGHRHAAALLTAVAFGALLVAWLGSSPPFAGPDETAHYLRAVSISDGTLLGKRVTLAATPAVSGLLRAQRRWNNHDTRAVLVPSRLSPTGFPCVDGKLDTLPSGCLEVTYTGDYPPLAYALPAVALEAASNADNGDWWGRAASELPVLAFLILAVCLVAALGPWALAGLLVAVTPMVLFVGSVLNPSGLECAAALACACAAFRIASDPEQSSRAHWVALALAGSAAILAWQLGVVFVLASLLVAGSTVAPDALPALRARARAAVAAGAALAAALIVSLVYGLSAGSDHGSIAIHPIITRLHGALDQFVTGVLPGAVGNFGALTVRLSTASDWVWWAAVLALIAGALWLGVRRDRVAVALAVIAAVGFPIAFFAFVYSNSGFGLQARYVLPLLMLVPLVCGVVLQRRSGAGSQGSVMVVRGLVLVVAAFQLYAWWFNARSSAGTHAVWFLSHAHWSPPFGWWPWTVLAVAGTLSMAALALSIRADPPAARALHV